jgi:hypothetical protein
MDIALAVCVRDQEDTDTALLAPSERAGKEGEAFIRECSHERGVIVHPRLLEGSFAVDPGGARFACDSEKAHCETAVAKNSAGVMVPVFI